jgi:hypothetical protein
MARMLAYRPMNPRLATAFSLALCLACAGAFADAQAARGKVGVSLAAGKVHEVCARLEPGQKRSYHWKSDRPVDFNIHYHRGDEVFYPVRREAMRGDGGTFTARTGEDYCWMWTARDATTKIEGGIGN